MNASGYSLGRQCWESNDYTSGAGHGTSVASLIGGATFGVAKQAILVDARAFGCNGYSDTARLAKVLEWIKIDPKRGNRSVINFSFSGQWYWDQAGYSAVNTLVQELVTTYNIPVVAAAGNDAQSAYWYSPANSQSAITVGGTNQANDSRWAYSNFGYTTAFYAPAQFVESAHTEPGKLRSQSSDCNASYYPETCTSGTSFAAPLASGAVAQFLQNNLNATRSQIVSYLNAESAAHSGVIILDPQGNGAPLLNINTCR